MISPERLSSDAVNAWKRSLLRFRESKLADTSRPVGKVLFKFAKEKGLEGIIAERKASIYRPGKRSPDWLKIKSRPQQEFVVCGFTEGKGSRKCFGALRYIRNYNKTATPIPVNLQKCRS